MKPPAFQFYPRDWITDPALSLCSPTTRGIWIDLLCAMWFATERGRLEGTPRSLARLARCTAQEMIRAIKELRASGAASVTCNANVTLCNTDVTIENRRMMRDEKVRLQTRLRVDKHRAKPCNAPSNAEVTPPSAVSAVSAVSASATDCKTKPKTPAAAPPGLLPVALQTDAFRKAWAEWIQHRKEARHPLTPSTIKKQLEKLAAAGPAVAVAMINQSIEKGWRGLFALGEDGGKDMRKDAAKERERVILKAETWARNARALAFSKVHGGDTATGPQGMGTVEVAGTSSILIRAEGYGMVEVRDMDEFKRWAFSRPPAGESPRPG